MDKKIVYSGIQPSGNLTLGNYIGALKNFSELQDEYNCLYCIVDMHAITVPQVPKDLRATSLDLASLYLAAGLDPEKSILYIQSHVKQHAELSWILGTITGLGQLQRMTQYKDKAAKQKEINAGLLFYPVLMAADILLYGTNFVPVGDDQTQHIELTRDIAERFNSRYSETFVVPEMMRAKKGARIMSLQDPTAKMSKSDADENASIYIIEDDKATARKIKRAVTDSIGIINYTDDQPGLKNLIDIYSVFADLTPEEIVKKYEGVGYGVFKEELAEIVVDGLKPIRTKFKEIRQDKTYLEEVLKAGEEKAERLAERTMRKVRRKVGFVQL
ncbi:tryptophan--tRNA ligase [Peptoniphilus sp.]|uniref:tryptophan--tRNA ligase n=1 Tax=Peptoniphilus sp. TaxID=1971214 RepID=UPI0039965825